jgi:hypothetical protein
MQSVNPMEAIGIAPPSPSRLDDPKHWRDRAAEARAMAERFGDPDAIETMIKVAGEYERLAAQAEARLKKS